MKKGWLIGLIILGILIIGTVVYVSVNAGNNATGDAARKLSIGRTNVSFNNTSVTPQGKSLGCIIRCIGHKGCRGTSVIGDGIKYSMCGDDTVLW